jgi:hypothetical protein
MRERVYAPRLKILAALAALRLQGLTLYAIPRTGLSLNGAISGSWPPWTHVLLGVVCIERSEIIQVLFDNAVALARPLLQPVTIHNRHLRSLVSDQFLLL